LNGCNNSEMFPIVLATQLSLPVALGLRYSDVRSVFSSDDFPRYVQVEGINRFVMTRTTIRSDGTPQDCSAESGSGDPKLDAYTCSIIVKRAKFWPAKWLDGSPAYGVLRVPIAWVIGGPASHTYRPDMELSVNRLPAGADSPLHVGLMIAVDETGRVVGCDQALPASTQLHAKTYPELVSIACPQMMSRFTALPAKDDKGEPVRSVQIAGVLFTTNR
jgi:Gram-negative bacterial TonB protein C-terminal